MSDAPEAPASEPDPAPAEPSAKAEPAGDDIAAVRREAASYRRQLRGAEAERDALREQLDRRDRADAERLAAESMAAGADLWVAGVELASLRDDDGALSPALVTEAAERVLVERPHWRKPVGAGFDGGARMPAPPPPPSFGEALKRASG